MVDPFLGAQLRQMATQRKRRDSFVPLAALDPAGDAEAQLGEYARTRDPGLRDHILNAYAPLVERTLLDFNHAGVSLDDLRQVGYVGLLTALELFDPTRGTKFKTYAAHLVRGEIRHYLRDHRDTIRQPRWLQRLNRQIEEAVGRTISAEGRFPSLQDLAFELNIQEAGLRELLKVREAVRTISLDAGEDEEQFEFDYRRIRHRAYASFQLPIEDKIVLYQAIERLNLLQRRVLYYLFFGGFTQAETAHRIGISQKHVSRILARSLLRLRGLLNGY